MRLASASAIGSRVYLMVATEHSCCYLALKVDHCISTQKLKNRIICYTSLKRPTLGQQRGAYCLDTFLAAFVSPICIIYQNDNPITLQVASCCLGSIQLFASSAMPTYRPREHGAAQAVICSTFWTKSHQKAILDKLAQI